MLRKCFPSISHSLANVKMLRCAKAFGLARNVYTCTKFTYNRLDLSFSIPKVFLTSSLPGRTPYGVLEQFCIALEPRGLITRG